MSKDRPAVIHGESLVASRQRRAGVLPVIFHCLLNSSDLDSRRTLVYTFCMLCLGASISALPLGVSMKADMDLCVHSRIP